MFFECFVILDFEVFEMIVDDDFVDEFGCIVKDLL